jgi:hypothetical protein
MRKTIKLAELTDRVNAFLRASSCPNAERRAVAMFVENILLQTGNYAGFTYLDNHAIDKDDAACCDNYRV